MRNLDCGSAEKVVEQKPCIIDQIVYEVMYKNKSFPFLSLD